MTNENTKKTDEAGIRISRAAYDTYTYVEDLLDEKRLKKASLEATYKRLKQQSGAESQELKYARQDAEVAGRQVSMIIERKTEWLGTHPDLAELDKRISEGKIDKKKYDQFVEMQDWLDHFTGERAHHRKLQENYAASDPRVYGERMSYNAIGLDIMDDLIKQVGQDAKNFLKANPGIAEFQSWLESDTTWRKEEPQLTPIAAKLQAQMEIESDSDGPIGPTFG